RFYPPTENNDVTKNHFERQTLKANLVQFENGGARIRIEGDLRMRHSFYHKEDGKVVEATFIGFIDFDPTLRSIRSFQLVTARARSCRMASCDTADWQSALQIPPRR